MTPRRDLIDAQTAIFRNHDAEVRAGVTEESDEYARLHERYYTLAAELPWWRRIGVWSQAIHEHDHHTDEPPFTAREGEETRSPRSGTIT